MITSHPAGPFEPTWDSLERYQTPEWYLDAKFGIFIHWGVYSVPAFENEWYPRHMYIQGSPAFEHHLKTYGPQDSFGYKDFVPRFTAENFHPTEWAELFQSAGAKFVTPVAEHHDGFAMYPTRSNRWNAAEMGPKRDVIGELATAVRAQGMVFGVSSHRAEHWWFMNGGWEFPSDVQDPELQDFYGPAHPGSSDFGKNIPSEQFMEDWLFRCVEIVDQYRPQLFWFDWWIEQPAFAPYLRRFAAYYYNRAHAWGKGVAINYKNEAFPEKAAVFDVERGQLAEIRARFWQTDTAVATNSWSFVDGLNYKTASSLIHDLVDIDSKNGALLLNIGPKADGTIPSEDQTLLREIGRWLAVNGEAIYSTRPWKIFGEGPTQVVAGSFHDSDRASFTSADIRFTTKGSALYATILSVPSDTIKVRSLGSFMALESREIESVRVLGGNSPVQWSRSSEALTIEPSAEYAAQHAVTYKIEFKG